MYKDITIFSFSEDNFVENFSDCFSSAVMALFLPGPEW